MGLLDYINFWFTSFLFSGIQVNLYEVIYPFRIFTWLFPNRYAYSSFVYVSFAWSPKTIQGATNCPVKGESTAANGCIYHETELDTSVEPAKSVGKVPGFSCGPFGSYSYNCLGYSGEEALESIYRLNITAVANENTVMRDMIVLLSMVVLLKVAHWIRFTKKSLRSPVLHKKFPG